MSSSTTGSHQYAANSDGATQSMANINIGKKGRGKGKLNWPKDGLTKEALEFDQHGVGVGEGAARFSRYLSILARDSNQIPLNYLRWDKVPQEKKSLLWEMMRGTIDWKPEQLPYMHIIKEVQLSHFASLWKNFIAEIKRKYYTPYIGMEERWKSGTDDVSAEIWRVLVENWDKSHVQENAQKNKENRSQHVYHHTGGTKCYARSKIEYAKKHGEVPDPITFFRDKHTRKDKEESWISESAKMKFVEMEQNLDTLVTVEGQDTLDLRQRAYVQAMGPETRNRVRGEGLGVMPHHLPWVQIAPTTSSRRSRGQSYIQLQSEYMNVQMTYQNRITELEEENQHIRRHMEEQQQRTQQQLDALSEKMNTIHSQPFQNLPSQEVPVRSSSHQQHIRSSQMPYYPSPVYPSPGYPPMFYQPPMIYPQAGTKGFTALLTGEGRQSDHEEELVHSVHSTGEHN